MGPPALPTCVPTRHLRLPTLRPRCSRHATRRPRTGHTLPLTNRTGRKNRRLRRTANVTLASGSGLISPCWTNLPTHGSSSKSSRLYGRESLDSTAPDSPLTFHPLLRIERASDLRYLEEIRRANAERVAAWNQLTIPLPARIPTSPLKRWCPKQQKQKSLPATPTSATFPPSPAVRKGYPPRDTSVHYLDNCFGRVPPTAWGSTNNFCSTVSLSQNTTKIERRKSGGSLKPLKTLWMKMKSHSNLKAA